MDEVEQLRRLEQRVARAGRAAVVGAGVGVVAGVLLGMAATAAGESVFFWLGLLVGPAALFGAAVGHLIGGGHLHKPLTDAAGLDAAADWIRRSVAGRPEILTPGERDRAARYAAVAAIALPAQATRWWLVFAAILIGQALRLTLGPAAGGLSSNGVMSAVLGLATALLFLSNGLARSRTGHRARAYAAAHPGTETPRRDWS